jgi:DNA primase
MEDRIVFPILDVRDKTICYVGRNTLSDSGSRYANYPAGVSIPLYPAKLESNPRNIILVEGLFDMLNCYDKGLTNVVCCFGTSKLYKDTSTKLFSYKVMGVEKIFLMYDGDSAGKEAMDKLKPLIEEAGFVVEIINLPEDTDPGDLSQDYVDSIIEYTK